MADPTLNPADLLAVDDAVARSTDSGDYGIGETGFVPKPFSRLLAEKLSLARSLFGADIDLASGSALRKILEVSALEDARTWAALATIYDNQYVSSARGEALSRLGAELGIARPALEARGTIKLTAHLPPGMASLALPRGARLLTPGGHHVYLDEAVQLSPLNPAREVAVAAFYPGPEHNLDPSQAQQKISWWNPADLRLAGSPDDATMTLFRIAAAQQPPVAPEQIVAIEHTRALSGGELLWPDARYRELLLRAPRSLWTTDAIQLAISLVPGVRQVQVRDDLGGVDANLAIFGNFNFIERLYSPERKLVSPYYFDLVVAATDAALWEGPGGLEAAIRAAIEDIRPVGILPNIKKVAPAYVAVKARVIVRGLALPRAASGELLNTSPAATALKARLLERVRRYVDGLGVGEPVRFAEVMWAMMNEPGVTDIEGLTLVPGSLPPDQLPVPGANVEVSGAQIATFVDSDAQLTVA